MNGFTLYVDAGTGSVVLYAIAGAFLGIAFSIKMFWWRLKEKFYARKAKPEE